MNRKRDDNARLMAGEALDPLAGTVVWSAEGSGAHSPRPVGHEEVLVYFEILFLDQCELALDWLATAPRLDRPTSALLLIGPGGLGKSMIPQGLSQLLGEASVVWRDGLKGVDPGALRALLACPRLVLTARPEEPLELAGGDLDLRDEDALGARLLIIDCNPAASAWLERYGGRDLTRDWVRRPCGSPGKIPETLVWLAQHRAVTPGPRWLVAGNAAERAARVDTRAQVPSSVRAAFTVYRSMDPQRRRLFGKDQPFLLDPAFPRHVIVSNQRLRAAWPALLGGHPPTPMALGEALHRLARRGNERVTLASGAPYWGYVVPLSLLELPARTTTGVG